MEALGINLGYILLHILSFVILLVTLRAWAYKPLLDALEKRRKTIAQGLEDAQAASHARANAERDAAQIITEAQQKANEIVREATDRAEVAAREIRAQREAEASKLRDTAMAEFEVERNGMLSELRGQVAALAISATQKLLGEALDEKRQHSLLEEFFSGVKSGRVTLLENAEMSGEAAEVTSALPLTAAEQETVKREVLGKLGDAATVSFRVDPAILGGLVVRVGDRVIDGSVSGQLASLRQNMQ